ncbi:hypothetical protein BZA77DRAFT_22363 [Pyronema omphalodes]|nr:hypothetical protein BZA77DRAFT_22363 [Pyronema omphalodes]
MEMMPDLLLWGSVAVAGTGCDGTVTAKGSRSGGSGYWWCWWWWWYTVNGHLLSKDEERRVISTVRTVCSSDGDYRRGIAFIE